jgi:hypothetical protein
MLYVVPFRSSPIAAVRVSLAEILIRRNEHFESSKF